MTAVVAIARRRDGKPDIVGGCGSPERYDDRGGNELLLPDGGALIVNPWTATIRRVDAARSVRCTWKLQPSGDDRTVITAVVPAGPRFLALFETDGAFRMPGVQFDAVPGDRTSPFAGVFGWRHSVALVAIDPDRGPTSAMSLGRTSAETVGLWALPDGDHVVYFDGSLIRLAPSGAVRWKRALGDVVVNDVRPEGDGLLVMTQWMLGFEDQEGEFLGVQHRNSAGEITTACGYRSEADPNTVVAKDMIDGFDRITEVIGDRIFALATYSPGFWFRCADGEPREATRFLDRRDRLLLVAEHGGEVWVVYSASCSTDAPNGAGIYAAHLVDDRVERRRLILADEYLLDEPVPPAATLNADSSVTLLRFKGDSVRTAKLWDE